MWTFRENTKLLQKAQAIFKIPLIVRQFQRLPFGTLFFSFLGTIFGNQLTYFLGIVDEIIKTRRQQGFMGRKDLLQLMIMGKDETTVDGVSRLTDEVIVAQSVLFLLAGYETSSNTLSFTAYFLATNPDVQEKLRTEIKDAMESNADISLYELTHSIEYLDCAIKESQRMCNPASQNALKIIT